VPARHPLGRGLPRILLLLHYRQRRSCPALRCGAANTKRLFVNKLFLHHKRSIYQDRLGTSIVVEDKLRGNGRSLLQAVKRDSSIAPALEQGDYAPLKVWLTENVWRHGMTRVLLLPCATHAISDLKTLVVCQDRLRTETCSGNLTRQNDGRFLLQAGVTRAMSCWCAQRAALWRRGRTSLTSRRSTAAEEEKERGRRCKHYQPQLKSMRAEQLGH
jgi:hypothetical protein